MDANLHGQSELRLDPKGRLILPAKFRPPFEAETRCYLARHQEFDHCLTLWTQDSFEAVVRRMEERQTTGDREQRNLARLWSSETEPVTLDKQFRLAIPNHMRARAGLGAGPVIVIGVIDHVEIWDRETWQHEVVDAVEHAAVAG